jgi:predicted O-methyltransferase YrrM
MWPNSISIEFSRPSSVYSLRYMLEGSLGQGQLLTQEHAIARQRKAASAIGKAGAQSQVQVHGAMPGGDAVSPAVSAIRVGRA